MSKYQELKERIEALDNGWDKEADDILQTLYREGVGRASNYWTMQISIRNGVNSGDCQEIKIINHKRDVVAEFQYSSQCEKNDALKSAFLWLLDHSDIKKNPKQEKIEKLEGKLSELQEEIRELKEE